MSNIICVDVPGASSATNIKYQFDYGQKLKIIGMTDSYAVDLCNAGDNQTETVYPVEDTVEIPDRLFETGRNITAYIVEIGEGRRKTVCSFTIPVAKRPAIPQSEVDNADSNGQRQP